MSEQIPSDTRKGRLEELRNQLQDDLAPVREHREVFERAADGKLPDVGEGGAAIARVWLAVLDGEVLYPEDVAAMDAYGERDDDGRRVKRMLAGADAERARADPRTWSSERRWSTIRGVARRFGIEQTEIEASYGTEAR